MATLTQPHGSKCSSLVPKCLSGLKRQDIREAVTRADKPSWTRLLLSFRVTRCGVMPGKQSQILSLKAMRLLASYTLTRIPHWCKTPKGSIETGNHGQQWERQRVWSSVSRGFKEVERSVERLRCLRPAAQRGWL